MPLNPQRDGLIRLGLAARRDESPFRAVADAALAGFRAARDDLERQVRRGDLTTKVARQRAAELAATLKRDLLARSESFGSAPGSFQERLAQAAEMRKRASHTQSIEALQRETNRLLRQALVEQQIVNRAVEFEGRAFVRPLAGGAPAPTLDSLLAFHEEAGRIGDEAAQEWARRQLEGLRTRTASAEDHRRIDAACDRPDRVNPQIVARYVEAMTGADAEALETFVAEALTSTDANACCAAFLLAREAPEGEAARWVRAVLDGLGSFPDAALNTLRAWDAEVHRQAAEAARVRAEYVATLAEGEARSLSTAAPSEADLRRQARITERPAAAPGEPIGLNLARRGLTPEELASATTEANGETEA
jgi:hypothetical protein